MTLHTKICNHHSPVLQLYINVVWKHNTVMSNIPNHPHLQLLPLQMVVACLQKIYSVYQPKCADPCSNNLALLSAPAGTVDCSPLRHMLSPEPEPQHQVGVFLVKIGRSWERAPHRHRANVTRELDGRKSSSATVPSEIEAAPEPRSWFQRILPKCWFSSNYNLHIKVFLQSRNSQTFTFKW